jgi:hypothetical protein
MDMSTIPCTHDLLANQATTAWAGWGRRLRIVAPLLVILVACVGFRMLLAKGEHRLLHTLDPELLAQPWKLLMPFDLGGGGRYRWTPTGFVPIGLLNLWMPGPYIFVLLMAILVIVSYVLSYAALRSRIFSSTLAICMSFGTQFNFSYVHSGGHLWILFTIYLLINLYFLHALATQPAESRWPKIGFIISLIVFALSWEQWLDYLVFLETSCLIGYLLCRRHAHLRARYLNSIRLVAVTSAMVGAVYLVVRLPYSGEHFTAGHESDTIFTYSAWLIGIDDLISSFFTYLYIAVTNFCPSWFNASNSLYHVGADQILREQDNYHPEKTHLVAMHHLFFWHFYAGMVLLGFILYFYRSLRRAWTAPSYSAVLILALLVLIGTGFATHTIIKFRPYLSVPLLAYKCIISVIGVSLLLSYGVTKAADWFTDRRRQVFVLAVWFALMLVGIERFSYQTQQSRQVGLGEFPKPMRAAKEAIRQTFSRSPAH